ncbi:hypothetical protein [Acetobacter malorum]|uniref:hypothetical protein n=1 Tax=Acetobacter malorum TaxID=178901 RepID=UPI0012E8D747|nr:hypothetical protein [Acetobacter malorum]
MTKHDDQKLSGLFNCPEQHNQETSHSSAHSNNDARHGFLTGFEIFRQFFHDSVLLVLTKNVLQEALFPVIHPTTQSNTFFSRARRLHAAMNDPPAVAVILSPKQIILAFLPG